jgi:hypothetical protein
MMYKAAFTGRTVGAIGIFYPITATVEAKDKQAAETKLYDRYEHIQQLTLTRVRCNRCSRKAWFTLERDGQPDEHLCDGCGIAVLLSDHDNREPGTSGDYLETAFRHLKRGHSTCQCAKCHMGRAILVQHVKDSPIGV